MEGTTIPVVSAEINPVENGAGLAVATVLVPPSEPPSSLLQGPCRKQRAPWNP